MKDESWDCPVCDKHHSKPSYALPGQIDYKVDPDNPGRVKFNRSEKTDYDRYSGYKDDTLIKKGSPRTGPAVNKDGYPNGLFCSHCGFEQKIIVITKVK